MRARAGLTQRQLAERMGKPQSMIARWERGHDVPRLDSLVAIAHACGVELDLTLRGHVKQRQPSRLPPNSTSSHQTRGASLRLSVRVRDGWLGFGTCPAALPDEANPSGG